MGSLLDGLITLSAWEIAFVYGAYLLGFYIRGAFGFGSNMPIVLLTTWVLGPHHTVLLVSMTAVMSQLHLLPQGIRTADWRVVVPVAPALIAGTAIGTWLLIRLRPEGLTVVMGALIVTIVLMDRLHVVQRLSRRFDLRSPGMVISLAGSSGLFGTVSGGGGIYFLVGYLRLVCPDPARLRSTNLVLSGSFIAFRILLLSAASLITLELMTEALVLMPAVFLGTWLGTRFFRTSSPERFYGALQALLLAAALALLAKGLVALAT